MRMYAQVCWQTCTTSMCPMTPKQATGAMPAALTLHNTRATGNMLQTTLQQWQAHKHVSHYKQRKSTYKYWNHFAPLQLQQLVTICTALIDANSTFVPLRELLRVARTISATTSNVTADHCDGGCLHQMLLHSQHQQRSGEDGWACDYSLVKRHWDSGLVVSPPSPSIYPASPSSGLHDPPPSSVYQVIRGAPPPP